MSRVSWSAHVSDTPTDEGSGTSDASAPEAPTEPTAPNDQESGTSDASAPEAPTEPTAPNDEESGSNDLERFYEALREIVRDARERLPLESDAVEAPSEATGRDDSAPPGRGFAAGGAAGTLAAPRSYALTEGEPVPATTELAPTTAELIASLEADRDQWRERAIVWRERAMGADLLVRTLNSHVSDLQINLDDLRLAMRAIGAEPAELPEPSVQSAELPGAGPPFRGTLDRLVEPGP